LECHFDGWGRVFPPYILPTESEFLSLISFPIFLKSRMKYHYVVLIFGGNLTYNYTRKQLSIIILKRGTFSDFLKECQLKVQVYIIRRFFSWILSLIESPFLVASLVLISETYAQEIKS